MSKISTSKIKLALFDVDETLLVNNSMLGFINFFFNDFYGDVNGLIKAEEYRLNMSHLREKHEREDLNRFYYAYFKGIEKTYLKNLGKQWFEATVYKKKSLFNWSVLKQLKKFKQDNYRIALVSGGFFAPLEPLAEYIETNDLLCVTPEENEGLLTGTIVGIQTIGEGKASAIMNYFKNDDVDWASSYAYGDHISDLPMLKLVGNPIAVGNDSELLKVAKHHNWINILN